MLKELRFVQGAVAKKDLVPSMTHFRIQNGTVRSFNGTLALCSPIALDLDCCPKAVPLVKAIGNCAEATTISMTPAGNRLSIRSGKFRAFVDTIDGETPHVGPDGEFVAFDGVALLAALRTLDPFIGNDASRPWTNGALFKGCSAFATNNTCMVEYWIGTPFPVDVSIPREAVQEILRIGEPPTHGQVHDRSMTFHYSDGRWIRTKLLDITGWPHDRITEILDSPHDAQPIHPEFFTGLATLKDLADGAKRIYIKDGALRTHETDEQGGVYDLGIQATGLYNLAMLGLLDGVVNTIDFNQYPKPCLFFGERLRGAIVGMRM